MVRENLTMLIKIEFKKVKRFRDGTSYACLDVTKQIKGIRRTKKTIKNIHMLNGDCLNCEYELNIKRTKKKKEKMVKTYFSFGQDHAHRYNNTTLDKDVLVVMETKTHEEARARMFELFGQKWSSQYRLKPQMEYFPKGVLKI